jgi:uncharacterized protein (DUF2252 family)
MTNEPTAASDQPSLKQRRGMGKSLREKVPREIHATWDPPAQRRDPIEILRSQDEGRLDHLLPIKYGRMVASPFAFLRGSAAVMASDLSETPSIGSDVVLCGDAHLSNFGVFGTPERKLIFDLNDFDEAFPGPWEWDLKRLAVSAVVAGREMGFKEATNRELAALVGRVYREALDGFAKLPVMDLWYFHVEADEVLKLFEKYSKKGHKSTKKMLKKARARTQAATLKKNTEVVDGQRRFINDPPLVVRLTELLTDEQRDAIKGHHIKQQWHEYLDSLTDDKRLLLSRFRIADAALRVGGVGSVGTRCWIVLLEGDKPDDAIILQEKEAGVSVLEQYVPKRSYLNHGQRIVICQKLIQASSDTFLGWHQSNFTQTHYYWRQLKDMKGSVDIGTLDKNGMGTYLGVCSVSLARAHARTGDAVSIVGYLGKGDTFDKALADFAVAYADQNERDHHALETAVNDGEIMVERGV